MAPTSIIKTIRATIQMTQRGYHFPMCLYMFIKHLQYINYVSNTTFKKVYMMLLIVMWFQQSVLVTCSVLCKGRIIRSMTSYVLHVNHHVVNVLLFLSYLAIFAQLYVAVTLMVPHPKLLRYLIPTYYLYQEMFRN